MLTSYESLVVGIVSGIFTTVLLYLITETFKKIVIPWYRQIIYKGVDISGEWVNELKLESGIKQTISASIIQKANNISGDVTMVKMKDGEQYGNIETFNLTGDICDRFLYAKVLPVDTKRVGIASLLLEIVGDGTKMKGATAWYDGGAAIIVGKPTEWNRAS